MVSIFQRATSYAYHRSRMAWVLARKALESVDGAATEQVARLLREARTSPFHTGKLKRKFLSRGLTGAHLIQLSQPKAPQLDANQPEQALLCAGCGGR